MSVLEKLDVDETTNRAFFMVNALKNLQQCRSVAEVRDVVNKLNEKDAKSLLVMIYLAGKEKIDHE